MNKQTFNRPELFRAILKYRIVSLFCILSFLMFAGCDKDEPRPGDENVDGPYDSVTLLYAVASNNLSSYFRADTVEIKKGAQDINLNRNLILVYSVTNSGNPTLRRLVKRKDKLHYEIVKEYDFSKFSTDPARINRVISDVTNIFKCDNNGLILWSHATGWRPDFSDHNDIPVNYSFGQDNTGNANDRCDIIELNEAIPSGIFHYIWFDCCFMGSVEVAYELRGKADFIVGYPTEIMAEGMPYDRTIPYLANSRPQLLIAAEELFSYYEHSTATIGVYNTSKLDPLADVYAEAARAPLPELVNGVHDYSRFHLGPFYDLYQLGVLLTGDSPAFDLSLRKALAEAVIYKDATSYDFRGVAIDKNRFSGISVHLYEGDSSENEEYYRKLAWYKRTAVD